MAQLKRILVYEGPTDWLFSTLKHDYVKGSVTPGPGSTITEAEIVALDPAGEEALRLYQEWLGEKGEGGAGGASEGGKPE